MSKVQGGHWFANIGYLRKEQPKRPLLCEYFLQRGQYIRKDLDRANPLDQSHLVNSSDLIEHDQPVFR
jgi:hypothetical protein